LSSFGAALLWSLPLCAIAIKITCRRDAAHTTIAILVVCLATFSSIPYLAFTYNINHEITAAVNQLEKALKDREGPLLAVNYPSNIGDFGPYLIGGYAARILPHRVPSDLSDFLYLNTGTRIDITNYQVDEIAQAAQWKYRRNKVRFTASISELQTKLAQQQAVFTTVYLDTITLREVGRSESRNEPKAAIYAVRFDDSIALLDYALLRADSEWQLTLRWQCWQTPTRDTKVFLHIYDSAGQLVSIQDAYPLGGLSLPHAWQPGDIWRDVRYISIPPELSTGMSYISVGLYHPDSDERMMAYGYDGSRLNHDEFMLDGSYKD